MFNKDLFTVKTSYLEVLKHKKEILGLSWLTILRRKVLFFISDYFCSTKLTKFLKN